MSELLEQLIEALREEMHEYGEMLMLLERPQRSGAGTLGEEALQGVCALRAQDRAIHDAARRRLVCQARLAHTVGQTTEAGLPLLLPLLPRKYQPLVAALDQENAQLRRRVHECVRHNRRQMGQALASFRESLGGEGSLLPAG